MDESKRQLWEGRFEEQANSGMIDDAWCTQKQLSKYTYYYWKQRIRKEKTESIEKNTATPLFAKLEMPTDSDERITKARLIIRWQGFELILSDHSDIGLATQFILASKKLLNGMKFQWPRTPSEVRKITGQQVQWLLQGLEIEQKKALQPVTMTLENNCF